jgi:hypothetical protein
VILVTDDDLAELQRAFAAVAAAFVALGEVWGRVLAHEAPMAPVTPPKVVEP